MVGHFKYLRAFFGANGTDLAYQLYFLQTISVVEVDTSKFIDYCLGETKACRSVLTIKF